MGATEILWILALVYGLRTSNAKLQFSKAVDGLVFRSIPNISLDACRKECMVRLQCHSINYFRMTKMCLLNKMGAIVEVPSQIASVYSEKSEWNDDTLDSSKCQVDEHGIVSCVKEECDKLIGQDMVDMNSIGSKAKYGVSCIQDINQFDSTRTFLIDRLSLICSPDGTWRLEAPPSGECLTIAAVLISGTRTDPFHAWEKGDNSRSDLACLRSENCPKNYRNDIIDLWDLLPISRIRFSVFKGGTEVKFVVFNGTGSDKTDWFGQDRISSSSWTDIMTSSAIRFSMEGATVDTHVPSARRFLMHLSINYCEGDNGWFVAVYKDTTAPCPYDGYGNPTPGLLFCRGNEACVFQSGASLADHVYILLTLNVS